MGENNKIIYNMNAKWNEHRSVKTVSSFANEIACHWGRKSNKNQQQQKVETISKNEAKSAVAARPKEVISKNKENVKGHLSHSNRPLRSCPSNQKHGKNTENSAKVSQWKNRTKRCDGQTRSGQPGHGGEDIKKKVIIIIIKTSKTGSTPKKLSKN